MTADVDGESLSQLLEHLGSSCIVLLSTDSVDIQTWSMLTVGIGND